MHRHGAALATAAGAVGLVAAHLLNRLSKAAGAKSAAAPTALALAGWRAESCKRHRRAERDRNRSGERADASQCRYASVAVEGVRAARDVAAPVRGARETRAGRVGQYATPVPRPCAALCCIATCCERLEGVHRCSAVYRAAAALSTLTHELFAVTVLCARS
jgi:hypothetical protein